MLQKSRGPGRSEGGSLGLHLRVLAAQKLTRGGARHVAPPRARPAVVAAVGGGGVGLGGAPGATSAAGAAHTDHTPAAAAATG